MWNQESQRAFHPTLIEATSVWGFPSARAKYQLPFPLLCDSNAEVATAYGCYGLKKFMGKEFMGITRSTFAIDPDGRIEKVYRKVKPESHAAEILADLLEISPE